MEIRHLRYFIAVAEELNFTRAAERLKMAQPPLSQQIKELENELGTNLFRRTKRKVELTESGRVFLNEARLTLQQLQKGVEVTRLAGSGKVGRLRVGFIGSAMDRYLIEIIQAFTSAFPDVTLSLKEMTSSQQLEALQASRIDIGFMRTFICNENFESKIYSEEPLVAVLPEKHPLAEKEKISIKEIGNDPFIFFPRKYGSYFYDLLTNFFNRHGVSLNVVQEAIHMHTIVNLVATGIGVSVVPESVQNFQRPGIKYLKILEGTPDITLCYTWSKNNTSSVLEAFIKLINEFSINK